MEISIGKNTKEISFEEFSALKSGFKKVIVDIGSGSGRFVYDTAKNNPNSFVIGIEPNRKSLEKYAAKINKKPSKGGLENALFVVASIETLPKELFGIADEVFIINPWGSLLTFSVNADQKYLETLSNLMKPDSKLTMHFNYSSKFEPESMEKFQVTDLSENYISESMKTAYNKFGFDLQSFKILKHEEFKSISASWSKKLTQNRVRNVWKVVFTKGNYSERSENNEIMSNNLSENDYTFTASGHPNILGKHAKTLEFTKDDFLTQKGDCILGINSTFDIEILKQFSGWITVKLSCRNFEDKFKCFINPNFESDDELVFRKSKFASERTFGILCEKGSSNIDRNIIECLKEGSLIKVTITRKVKKIHVNKYKQK